MSLLELLDINVPHKKLYEKEQTSSIVCKNTATTGIIVFALDPERPEGFFHPPAQLVLALLVVIKYAFADLPSTTACLENFFSRLRIGSRLTLSDN